MGRWVGVAVFFNLNTPTSTLPSNHSLNTLLLPCTSTCIILSYDFNFIPPPIYILFIFIFFDKKSFLYFFQISWITELFGLVHVYFCLFLVFYSCVVIVKAIFECHNAVPSSNNVGPIMLKTLLRKNCLLSFYIYPSYSRSYKQVIKSLQLIEMSFTTRHIYK